MILELGETLQKQTILLPSGTGSDHTAGSIRPLSLVQEGDLQARAMPGPATHAGTAPPTTPSGFVWAFAAMGR